MSIAGTSLNEFAGAIGRGLINLGRKMHQDEAVDPREQGPLRREDMAALFEIQDDSPFAEAEKLRVSERLERQTMSMIRSALYPSDGPRADSKT